MYVYKYVHMNVGTWETMYVGSLRGGGVSGSHEPPGVAAENWIQVLCEIVRTLNHGDISLAQNVLTF